MIQKSDAVNGLQIVVNDKITHNGTFDGETGFIIFSAEDGPKIDSESYHILPTTTLEITGSPKRDRDGINLVSIKIGESKYVAYWVDVKYKTDKI